MKNRATGRKVRPITDVISIALGKEEMAVRTQAVKRRLYMCRITLIFGMCNSMRLS
jgi:hypothetical protein